MPRRSIYRERIQFSWLTLLATVATVPLLVLAVRWLAELPLFGLAGLVIGMGVAITAFRLLHPEETRTLYLQMLVACLVGTYACWIPDALPYYIVGVGLGLLLTWQGPAMLTALFVCYGISRVKYQPMPRWRPSMRNPTWPGSLPDSSDLS